MFFNEDSDTICALSTPPGIGGISVVRISGQQAYTIVKSLCPWLADTFDTHTLRFGTFYSSSGAEIDHVLLSLFKKGKSFTGEETVEISCHGSPIVVSQILEALASTGARFAKPGEFTYRAFNNGNLDLIQAESIIGIIHSNSKKAASQALRQLSGDLSKQISIIENELISCLAHIEASIDFSTEGLDILSDGKILSKLKSISESINKLVSGYRSGRVIKDGLKVVLSGRPNVGKSSLLNLLLGEDKAIVTELAGTTRDLVEGALFVDGIKVNLIDTAGIRDSLDKVEKLGIQKSLIVRAESDVVIYVIDGLCGFTDEDDEQLRSLDTEQLIILVNKLDLMTESQSQVILNQIKYSNFFNTKSLKSNFLNERVLLVSALDKRSIDSISKLVMSVVRASGFQDDSLISQARHYEGLVKSLNLIQSSIEGLNSNAGVEYIAFDLKEALIHLQGVMGKVFDDQIMDRVFKEFCIGK